MGTRAGGRAFGTDEAPASWSVSVVSLKDGRMGQATEERPWILLFDSIHYVLAAERAFGGCGVRCDVVPVPRELSSDCGMAVEFRPSDIDAVRGMRAEGSVKPRAVYRRTAGGHDLVEEFARPDGAAGVDTLET